jgi:hypothetical protein
VLIPTFWAFSASAKSIDNEIVKMFFLVKIMLQRL